MKKRSSIIIAVVVVVISIALGGYFLYLRSFKMSQEYRNTPSHFLFEVKKGDIYFVRIDDESRMVHVVRFPRFSFDPVTKSYIESDYPEESLRKVEKLLNLGSNGSFYALVDEESIDDFSKVVLKKEMKDFGSLLKALAKRSMNPLDIFKIHEWLRKLSTDTNLNRYSFYKFLYALSNFGVRYHEAVGITKKPVVVKVEGKTLKRIYLIPEKIKELGREIGE